MKSKLRHIKMARYSHAYVHGNTQSEADKPAFIA